MYTIRNWKTVLASLLFSLLSLQAEEPTIARVTFLFIRPAWTVDFYPSGVACVCYGSNDYVDTPPNSFDLEQVVRTIRPYLHETAMDIDRLVLAEAPRVSLLTKETIGQLMLSGTAQEGLWGKDYKPSRAKYLDAAGVAVVKNLIRQALAKSSPQRGAFASLLKEHPILGIESIPVLPAAEAAQAPKMEPVSLQASSQSTPPNFKLTKDHSAQSQETLTKQTETEPEPAHVRMMWMIAVFAGVAWIFLFLLRRKK